MTDLAVARPSELDWPALGEELDRWGYAVTPPLLDEEQCREFSDLFDVDEAFRSTIVMSRHAFGEGTYRYFADPLPPVVQQLRVELYEPLAKIANEWAAQLGTGAFPETLDGLIEVCAAAGQRRPTPLLLRYWAGGYNCLHQDLYGEVAFPLQVTIMLSAPGRGLHRGREHPRGAASAPAVAPGRGPSRARAGAALPHARSARAWQTRTEAGGDAARRQHHPYRRAHHARDHLPQRRVGVRQPVGTRVSGA